jgi:hypothetical protein
MANNFLRPFVFKDSLQFIKHKIEELKPDKVINFYEKITSMAYGIYRLIRSGIEMITLGISMLCSSSL